MATHHSRPDRPDWLLQRLVKLGSEVGVAQRSDPLDQGGRRIGFLTTARPNLTPA
jgi:hypothetical protein